MDEAILHEEDSKHFRFHNPFCKIDVLCGLAVGIIAFIVYAWTTAPNVTLEDSGEFTVAAQHFGVPHPSGYAMWTMTAWLFSRLPLGNAAWEIALYSGVCGAFAMALFAMLLNSSMRYFFADLESNKGRLHHVSTEWLSFIITLAFGLSSAWNVSLWSQAVIVEVYAMHTVLTFLFLTSLYVWIHNRFNMWFFVAVMFFYALGLSNHHLTIPFVLVAIVLLALLRLDSFLEFLAYLLIAGAAVYGFFAYLSNDPLTPGLDDEVTVKTAIRFAIFSGIFLLVIGYFKGKLRYWKQGIGIVAAMFLGLSPYLYQPLASSTNPPMNWGYNRTRAGFFYSINRSQYSGSLSGHLINTVGKGMGAAPLERPAVNEEKLNKARLKLIQRFSGVYWMTVAENFTPIIMIMFMLGFVCLLFLEYERRVWLLVLFILFLITAFLQFILYPLGVDKAGWDVQLPFHTVSFALVPFVAAMSAGGVSYYLLKRYKISRWWAILWLFFPLVPLINNYHECSQRNHWFGWHFGYDMLKDLPKDSVVYGGTDAGRFVPTYMILCESFQEPRFKKDPNFDRRDLYIITQNALADVFYQQYIHDHYSDKRPQAKGWFEKWLGRDKTYPKDTLILPTKEEVDDMIQNASQKAFEEGKPSPFLQDPFYANSLVAEWIFLKNRDKHEFFVEESVPMLWSYPYAIPHGLSYKINHDPLDKLPPEVVRKDREFWKKYKAFLLADPEFKYDIDAQKDFAKLRMTMANIYKFRKMNAEWELAMRDALELFPNNTDALNGMLEVLITRGEFDEAISLVDRAAKNDPNNIAFDTMAQAIAFAQMEGDLNEKLKKNPSDPQVLGTLLKYYRAVRNDKAADQLVEQALKNVKPDSRVYTFFINYYLEVQRVDQAKIIAEHWTKTFKDDPEGYYALARLQLMSNNIEGFYKTASQAIAYGGIEVRQRLVEDPIYDPLRYEPRFMDLLDAAHIPDVELPKQGNASPKGKPKK